MPSRILEPVPTEDEPKKEEAPIQSSTPSSSLSESVKNTKSIQQKRKITPTTAENTRASAGVEPDAVVAKSKQQKTLFNFFSKSKNQSTPSIGTTTNANANANANAKNKNKNKVKTNKKEAPTTKSKKNVESVSKPKPSSSALTTPATAVASSFSSAKTKPSTATSSSSTVAKKSNKKRHQTRSKMDLKDIVVMGKVTTARKAAAATTSSSPSETSSGSIRHDTSSNNNNKLPVVVTTAGKEGRRKKAEDLEAVLPRIPPLSDVLQKKKNTTAISSSSSQATATTTPAIDEATHQTSLEADESDEGEEIGAVRLVDKFENSTGTSAAGAANSSSNDNIRGMSAADEKVVDMTEVEDDDEPAKEGEGADIGAGVTETTKDVVIMMQEEEPESQDNNNNNNNDDNNQADIDTKDDNDDDHEGKKKMAVTEVLSIDDGASSTTEPTAYVQPLPPAPPAAGSTKSTHLDSESAALLHKHETMRVKYCQQASELVLQARNGFVEETSWVIAMPSTEGISLIDSTGQLTDDAIPHLVCLLEGSKLPLSELASRVLTSLTEAFDGVTPSLEVVSSKIKLLASRKAYVKNPAVASGLPLANTTSKDIDVYEDANPDHMWRWEVTTPDFLPKESMKAMKAARAVRRRLQNRFNAIARLLGALNESIRLLGDATTKQAKAKIDKAVSKISREEEKVLKFEQEEEKARLSAEAKKQKATKKQKTGKEEQDRHMEEKRKAQEEKKREKEEAKRQKEAEKQKKALEKQKKAQEKEEAKRQKEEKERQKEKAQEKQKKRMMSFFGAPVKKTKKEDTPLKPAAKASLNSGEKAATLKNSLASDRFHNSINSLVEVDKNTLFRSLSKRAIASRKRKTKIVQMRVFVSGIKADDPFSASPAYAEEKIIDVRNRNKFLSFQEDCRPPYHGTWSKYNKLLARNPFSMDASLDYDVDSEAEWEEGDDDPGEDVENDAGDDEDEKMLDNEEGDTRVYNYQDGWLAEDDDIIKVDNDAEMDEQTKALVKASKKRPEGVNVVPVCIVAPAFGGVPIVEKFKLADNPLLKEHVEGIPVEDAYSVATKHTGATLIETDLYLDAFPPALTEERVSSTGATSPPANKEPTKEDLKTIAKFVHHSKLQSKSQVVHELLKAHATVTASRAQATRTLDSIAEKKRHPTDGVYWEVKQDVIDDLGLGDELKPMVLPDRPAKKDSKKRKADSDTKKLDDSKAKKAKTDAGNADGATKSKGSAKKKPSKASANLLRSFLVRSKKK